MKVIVTMAGLGSRFVARGITTPKPLISVVGRPMVAWALQSLATIDYSEIIFVLLKDTEEKYNVSSLLRELVGDRGRLVLLNSVTEGQLCSVLAAHTFIDTDEDLLIASADTYVVSPLSRDIASLPTSCRGLVSVARIPGDCWSFARVDESGLVVEVAEIVRISEHASTGLYYFANGREFVAVAEELVHNRETTRGEFYVISVYQKYIERGWKVGISVASQMWDMGTPEAMEKFVQHVQSV
jgi:dTDP-glucose pyrophosphorylase